MGDWIYVCITAIFHIGLTSAETCVNWYEGDKECDHGCCGNYGDYDCCFHWKVYAIVGGVIGGLVILGGIAALIFFFCFYQKNRTRRQTQTTGGQVLQTYTGNAPYTTQTTASYPGNQMTYPGNQMNQHAPNYPAASQPYPVGFQMTPTAPTSKDEENNSYGIQNPAYPPPPPTY